MGFVLNSLKIEVGETGLLVGTGLGRNRYLYGSISAHLSTAAAVSCLSVRAEPVLPNVNVWAWWLWKLRYLGSSLLASVSWIASMASRFSLNRA